MGEDMQVRCVRFVDKGRVVAELQTPGQQRQRVVLFLPMKGELTCLQSG